MIAALMRAGRGRTAIVVQRGNLPMRRMSL